MTELNLGLIQPDSTKFITLHLNLMILHVTVVCGGYGAVAEGE